MSALPGRRPGDGQGDLINAYAVKLGEQVEIRRTPGLTQELVLPSVVGRTPRGMHALSDRLFHAWNGELRVYQGGLDGAVSGALPGTDRVTMAHNMRDVGQNVVVVSNTGAYLVNLSGPTIAAYPDPLGNLGAVSSVEYFAGYFVFTKPSGYFVVSDLQSTAIPDNSFGKTEYQSDILYRAKAMQTVLLLMSSRSIEVWVDVATIPMPFTRQTTLDIGLLGKEYNTTSGSWHRRDSHGLSYWRGCSATQFDNLWLVQDLVAGKVFEVAQEVFSEDGERLRFRAESGAIKAFPASVRIPSIDIDCIVGLGQTRVPSPYQTDPVVMVSWSHDGGANWSRPVARSMGKVGRYANKVSVNNLGRSTHHGVRIRIDIVDPVPATILGGVSVATKPSRARQVNQ
jgi:hypothetical protein